MGGREWVCGSVLLLLNYGADVNVEDNDGRTALHRAAENGHEDVVRVLLDHGARVDTAHNADNRTAIYSAAETGSEGVVRLLLQYKLTLISRTARTNGTALGGLERARVRSTGAIREVQG